MPEINEIPDLTGLWEYRVSVLRRNNLVQVPDVNNIIRTIPTIGTIQQNGEFIVLTLPPDATRSEPGYLLGTLTKTHTGSCCRDYFWTLTFSDFDDNGVFTLTASEITCDGFVLEWKGHYTEPGFAGMSPAQIQTAGIATLKRVPLTEAK